MSEAHEIVEAAFGMIAQNIEKENDHGKKIIEKASWFKENHFTDEDELYVGVDVHKRQCLN